MEPGILGYGIQIPTTTSGIQYLESARIDSVPRAESTRLQDCLGFPYMGRTSGSLFQKQPRNIPIYFNANRIKFSAV